MDWAWRAHGFAERGETSLGQSGSKAPVMTHFGVFTSDKTLMQDEGRLMFRRWLD
jgi:hypothetical protein